jgi:hypothetical protein
VKTHYTWDQIKESNLLSEQRQKEIENLVNARFEDVYNSSGQKLEGVKSYYIFKDGQKQSFIYNTKYESFDGYYFREIMQEFLTDDEVKTIEKFVFSAAEDKRNEERVKKAKKVKISEYNGYIFWNDKYFSCLDDLLEEFEYQGVNKEDVLVWGTKKVQIISKYNVSDIIENDLDGLDDIDLDYFDGVKELQESLDKFYELNKDKVSYEVDYGILIEI